MPTQKTLDRFHAVLPQISALLLEWCERLNERTSPLPPFSIAAVNTVLEQVRLVLARERDASYVRPLPLRQLAIPGDAFVALLQSHVALMHYANRHQIDLLEHEDGYYELL